MLQTFFLNYLKSTLAMKNEFWLVMHRTLWMTFTQLCYLDEIAEYKCLTKIKTLWNVFLEFWIIFISYTFFMCGKKDSNSFPCVDTFMIDDGTSKNPRWRSWFRIPRSVSEQEALRVFHYKIKFYILRQNLHQTYFNDFSNVKWCMKKTSI